MPKLIEVLKSIKQRDPAAQSLVEIALLYPGVRAVCFHRVSGFLWRHKWHLLARLISELGRFFSGIEIHPGARIGERLFIDHGMGVVIGETAEIGHDVTLYHGVTLGGLSPHDGIGGKRHPTIKDRVVIGAGAQVLGPITVHYCARVGANAVVTSDVLEGATVIGNPAKAVTSFHKKNEDAFAPYGVTREELPDPIAKAIDGLMSEIEDLRQRIVDMTENEETNLKTGSPSVIKTNAPGTDIQ